MKTRLLIILAALLVGANAFAQSGSTEPLKGDATGDGVVDISDYIGVANIILTGKP